MCTQPTKLLTSYLSHHIELWPLQLLNPRRDEINEKIVRLDVQIQEKMTKVRLLTVRH